jgi:hypothetical protein
MSATSGCFSFFVVIVALLFQFEKIKRTFEVDVSARYDVKINRGGLY